jgi:hypothetical protein
MSSTFTSNSRSVRTQIRTLEDGTVQEKRIVTQTGPDGVPFEETTIINHDSSRDQNQDNSDIQNLDPIRILFGGHEFQGQNEPRIQPVVNNIRNQFLNPNASRKSPSESITPKTTFQPPFEIPDYSKKFSENLSKIIRP